jgi:hypothetical protein
MHVFNHWREASDDVESVFNNEDTFTYVYFEMGERQGFQVIGFGIAGFGLILAF